MVQVSTSTAIKFDRERENYKRELHDLRSKYLKKFSEILKEMQSEQITATNH